MVIADNEQQLYCLFLFGGFGFLLGIYYDGFRVWRVLCGTPKHRTLWQDMAFMLTAAPAFFLLSLALTGGAMRWYLFGGTLLGFAAYRATVGRVLVRAVVRLRRVLGRVGRRVWRVLTAPLRWLLSLLRVPLAFLGRTLKKIGHKFVGFFKKLLQFCHSILYTIKRKKKVKKGTLDLATAPVADRPSAVLPVRRRRL